MTGIELSTAAQAQDRAERIRTALNVSWQLIKDAYLARDWVALGYDSWDDYCAREFDTSRIKLPREERQEVVASMREIGMSTRAIGAATGISYKTVQRELAGGTNVPTESGPVTGTDGKTYTPRPASQSSRPEPPSQAGPNEEIPTTTIIGKDNLDELNQPAPGPEPAKPRRAPITDQFTAAVVDLNRVLDKFHRISTDRNFNANKNQVATLHGSDLARAISELQTLVDSIN